MQLQIVVAVKHLIGMLKIALLFLLFGMIPLLYFGQERDLFSLDEFRWDNRMLLIFSSDDKNPELQLLLKQIRENKDEILDRDLRVLVLVESGQSKLDDLPLSNASAMRLKERYRASFKPVNLILIGKDGGVKQRQSGDIELHTIFPLIDSMPMRKAEMSRRQRKAG